jgi:hypothetical protein
MAFSHEAGHGMTSLGSVSPPVFLRGRGEGKERCGACQSEGLEGLGSLE